MLLLVLYHLCIEGVYPRLFTAPLRMIRLRLAGVVEVLIPFAAFH